MLYKSMQQQYVVFVMHTTPKVVTGVMVQSHLISFLISSHGTPRYSYNITFINYSNMLLFHCTRSEISSEHKEPWNTQEGSRLSLHHPSAPYIIPTVFSSVAVQIVQHTQD